MNLILILFNQENLVILRQFSSEFGLTFSQRADVNRYNNFSFLMQQMDATIDLKEFSGLLLNLVSNSC
jgi:hypothetical protein